MNGYLNDFDGFCDQAEEDREYELNAQYDYISEAYGATARDCNDFAADEAAYEFAEAWINVCDDMEAHGGPLPKLIEVEFPF